MRWQGFLPLSPSFVYGLKENVIVGHLIPAGTGFQEYENVEMVKYADNIPTDQEETKTEEEEG